MRRNLPDPADPFEAWLLHLVAHVFEAGEVSATGGRRQTETRRLAMATALGRRQTVPLEDVVLAPALQFAALLNVLEPQGVIRNAELLAEIVRLRAKTPKGR